MVLSRLSLSKYIRRLKDPRLNRRKRHLLSDILPIAILRRHRRCQHLV